MRILMVEDDKKLCIAISAHIKQAGWQADFAHAGDDGLHFAAQNAYDLIILDRMLPHINGTTLVSTLRSKGIVTPVLMLTALGTIQNRVEGLDAGADDYLVKPFAAEELLARIRALTRRPTAIIGSEKLTFSDLSLDLASLAFSCGEEQLTLSKREGAMMALFVQNPRQTLTREVLLARIWGPDAPVEDGNLDNYIHFLRRRLTSLGSICRIATARGIGYRLEDGAC